MNFIAINIKTCSMRWLFAEPHAVLPDDSNEDVLPFYLWLTPDELQKLQLFCHSGYANSRVVLTMPVGNSSVRRMFLDRIPDGQVNAALWKNEICAALTVEYAPVHGELPLIERPHCLRAAVELTPTPMFCKDVEDDLRYVAANQACNKFFGKNIEGCRDFELWSQELADIIRKDDLKLVEASEASTGFPAVTMVFEEPYIYSNGKTTSCQVHKTICKDTDGHRFLIGVAIYESEESKSGYTKFLESILNNIAVGVSAKCPEDNFRYCFWNRELERQFGVSAEAAVGHDDYELNFLPDQVGTLRELDQQACCSGSVSFDGLLGSTRGRKQSYHVGKQKITDEHGRSMIITSLVDMTDSRLLLNRYQEMIDYQKELVDKAEFANECLKLILHSTDYEKLISSILEMARKEEHADRAYIYYFQNQSIEVMDCRFEVCAPGIEPMIKTQQNLSSESLKTLRENLSEHREIAIDDVEAMDDDYSHDKRHLQRQGIRSLLVVPLYLEDRAVGFFGLDFVSKPRCFSQSDIRAANNVSSLLSLAETFSRKQRQLDMELVIRQQLFERMKMPLIVFNKHGQVVGANSLALKNCSKTLAEVIGKRCSTLVCGMGMVPEWCPVMEVITTKQPAKYKYATPDGHLLLCSAIPVVSPENELEYIIHFAEDITLSDNIRELC